MFRITPNKPVLKTEAGSNKMFENKIQKENKEIKKQDYQHSNSISCIQLAHS